MNQQLLPKTHSFFSNRSIIIFRRLLWLGFLLVPVFLVPAAQAQDAAAPSFPSTKVSGDFRFRHEHVEKQGGLVSAYEQQRIRARLGAVFKPEQDIDVEFRMATGAGRVSTNQTLGNNSSTVASTQAMSNYSFLLDRANAKVQLDSNTQAKVGRFGNPFYQPADSDLVWDSDLNFDGVAWKWKSDGAFSVFVNTGFFWVLKDLSSPGKDVLLGSLQTGFQSEIGSNSKLGFEIAYHAYSGIHLHQGLTSASSTDGNTYDASGSTRIYDKSFKLVELGIDYTLNTSGKALTFYNQYITNTKANPSPGYIVGMKWGVLKEIGDYSFSYDYRKVPQNSTVGAFTDGDSFGGGTNGYSHKVSFGYQVKKSWNLVATYVHGRANIADEQERQNRKLAQLDLNYKF